MNRVITSDGAVPVKIWASILEKEAEEQSLQLAQLPFIFKHVALMPDCHAGKGSTVGTVFASKGAIIPATIGVDIGCGMSALNLGIPIEQIKDLPKLRHSIERAVPTGFFTHKTLSVGVQAEYDSLGPLSDNFMKQDIKKGRLENILEKAKLSLGTLGGGNHFIEVCTDENGIAWIMIHTGSRNIGNMIAQFHIKEAQNLMEKFFIKTPNKDLAYLPVGTPEFDAYWNDLKWAQQYAAYNRIDIMNAVKREVMYHVGKMDMLGATFLEFPEYVTCHHNFVNLENHFGSNVYVTRKGAISAAAGQMGIIPGSMSTNSFIVKGLGNADSFESCSHGAGRSMSRTKAKNTFTLQDVISQTNGVECDKSMKIVDELPGAYKPIESVMQDQIDLVEPIHKLKQVLCVKGVE